MQFGPVRDWFWVDVHQVWGQGPAMYNPYMAGQIPYDFAGMWGGEAMVYGPDVVYPHSMVRGIPTTHFGYAPQGMPQMGCVDPCSFQSPQRGDFHQNVPVSWEPHTPMGHIQDNVMASSQTSPIKSPRLDHRPNVNLPRHGGETTHFPNKVNVTPSDQLRHVATIRDDRALTRILNVIDSKRQGPCGYSVRYGDASVLSDTELASSASEAFKCVNTGPVSHARVRFVDPHDSNDQRHQHVSIGSSKDANWAREEMPNSMVSLPATMGSRMT